MKTRYTRSTLAFTVMELLVTVVAIAILAALLLPGLGGGPRYRNGPRINCASNLKQIGVAFRVWEGDNNDLYPPMVFTNESGTMEFADATNSFRYFQVMSNELNNTKVLVCPDDSARKPAADFNSDLSGTHISYFIGLDADEKYPTRLLSGDRSLTNGFPPANGILYVTTNQTVGWSKKIHQGNGNVLLADGSVQQCSVAGLRAAVAATGLATNRLAFP